MSVEHAVVCALVEEGSPRAAFRKGITKLDFDLAAEEFEWLVRRYERNKAVNRRVFSERFPDFDFIVYKENMDDLLDELREERAYSKVYSILESVSEDLLPENAIEKAEVMREVLGDVVKSYSPHSEISVKHNPAHYEQVRQHRIMAKKGLPMGMPLFIPSIDYHFDGLCWGRLYGVLARPGEGKSMLQAWIAWISIKTGFRVGLFSPEMNEFEHTCRMHTFASADPWVQQQVGITKPFKNRALMRGIGFNMKEYKRFCDFFETLPGECHIFTKKYRSVKMTPAYIASRVEDLGLQGIMVDPISKIATLKRKDNPVWELQDKVDQLQSIAKEQNIFAVATNWSNRQNVKKDDAPTLDESFGSDALAQESDHVIGLKYDPDETILMMRCTKSRFGRNKFRVYIECDPDTGLWQETDIPAEIHTYRLSLNGSAPFNGNAPHPSHNGNGHKMLKKVKKVVKHG